jgi:flagellar biosynthesis/type III secretory pathway chaperone
LPSYLSHVQGDLLALLGRKGEALASKNYTVLSECTAQESDLLARLEACHACRQELLEAARAEGRPASTVEELAGSIETPRRKELRREVTEARRRMRLLQHQSLANWVVAQRTLIHLSQLIEVVATGGKMRSTYGTAEPSLCGGSLVDHQA